MLKQVAVAGVLALLTSAAAADGVGPAQRCAVPYSVFRLTDPSDFAQFFGVGIAVRQNGRPIVAFYAREANETSNVSMWAHSCLDRACSPGMTQRIYQGGPFVAGEPQILMRANGHPLIVNGAESSIAVFDCADNKCRSGVNRHITAPYSNLYVGGTALDSQGHPAFVFYDQYTKTIEYTHCEDADCTSATRKTLATEPLTFAIPTFSITITADDRVVATYSSFGDNGSYYRLLTCASSACDAPHVETLADIYASSHSVVVRTDGTPLIAEYSGTLSNPTAKIRSCGDATCSTSAAFTPPGFGGSYLSATIGSDGIPMIGIADISVGYYRCKDDTCTDGDAVWIASTPSGGTARIASTSSITPYLTFVDYATNAVYAAACSEDDVFSNDSEPDLDREPLIP